MEYLENLLFCSGNFRDKKLYDSNKQADYCYMEKNIEPNI